MSASKQTRYVDSWFDLYPASGFASGPQSLAVTSLNVNKNVTNSDKVPERIQEEKWTSKKKAIAIGCPLFVLLVVVGIGCYFAVSKKAAENSGREQTHTTYKNVSLY